MIHDHESSIYTNVGAVSSISVRSEYDDENFREKSNVEIDSTGFHLDLEFDTDPNNPDFILTVKDSEENLINKYVSLNLADGLNNAGSYFEREAQQVYDEAVEMFVDLMGSLDKLPKDVYDTFVTSKEFSTFRERMSKFLHNGQG